MNIIKVENEEVLDELYDESALTFEGCMDSQIHLYVGWVKERAGLEKEDVYVIKGELMNRVYGLTGDNAYKDDLTILCFKLSDMENVGRIVYARFELDGRWFDDVVENNKRREEEC